MAQDLYHEFKDFLLKQNALALAIGVIIGMAIGKVVSAIVDDIINPIIGLILPGGQWRSAGFHIGNAVISYGDLIGRIVDFIIICAVVFFITKAFLPKPGEAPKTKQCTECRETIPADARRCKSCCQPQGV